MSIITDIHHEHDLPDEVELFVADVRKAICLHARSKPLLHIVVVHQGQKIPISDCLQHFRFMQYAAHGLFIEGYDDPDVPMHYRRQGGDSRVSQDDVRDGKLQEMRKVISQKDYTWAKPKEVPIPKPRSDGPIDIESLLQSWRRHPADEGAELRPLSVPSTESRIQGKILSFVMSTYLEENGYFDRQVIGFRPGRSIIGSMIGLKETIQKMGYIWAVAADLSKFYDTIPVKACLQHVADALGMQHDEADRSPANGT